MCNQHPLGASAKHALTRSPILFTFQLHPYYFLLTVAVLSSRRLRTRRGGSLRMGAVFPGTAFERHDTKRITVLCLLRRDINRGFIWIMHAPRSAVRQTQERSSCRRAAQVADGAHEEAAAARGGGSHGGGGGETRQRARQARRARTPPHLPHPSQCNQLPATAPHLSACGRDCDHSPCMAPSPSASH